MTSLNLAEYEDMSRINIISQSLIPKTRPRFSYTSSAAPPPPPPPPVSDEVVAEGAMAMEAAEAEAEKEAVSREELTDCLEQILDFVDSVIEIIKIHQAIRDEAVEKARV